MLFRSLGIQESNTSNGVQIGAETKKLWPFEDNRIKLCENFATAKSATKSAAKSTFCCIKFRSTKPISRLRNELQNEIHLWKFRKVFRSRKTTCKHTCATSQVETPSSQLRTTLQNHLQVAKSRIQLAKSKFKPGKWTIQRVNHLAKSTFSCEMDNSTCKIHLCKLRYFLPT